MNKAKAYLLRIRKLTVMIDQLEEELEDTRSRAMSTQSPALNADKVQTSGNSSKIEDSIIRIRSIEEQIAKRQQDLLERRNLAILQIHALESTMYIEILFKRYVQFKRLEQIADEMHYSFGYIRIEHGKALREFEKTFLSDNTI